MSLINSNDRFSVNPTNIRGVQRSKFDMSHSIKTTFNVGDLVPFDVMEILPGDTFNVETNTLTRIQTLLTPIMDDLYLDVYYFFVPNRLVWEHWKEFNGENTKSAWYPTTTYTIPQILIKSNASLSGSILDYMGVPTNTVSSSQNGFSLGVNALPVRAYNLIWNEWFRDQNLQDPILVSTNDSNTYYSPDRSYSGGAVLKVNKYHDYFTSALPSPQKGPDVTISMLGNNKLPVFADIDSHSYSNRDLEFRQTSGRPSPTGYYDLIISPPNAIGGTSYVSGKINNSPTNSDDMIGLSPSNLWADINGTSVATINELRLAFATQQLYELDARGGTRYVEIIKSHFGVTSPDARQQRPELLSYQHLPISVNQVVQQSGTTDSSALGDIAGLSVTADSSKGFVKSFTEHGYVIGLCCARYKHSYQQGINRMWSRKTRFDYYWPVFANIGEQPILNKEIYQNYNLSKTDDLHQNENDEVFGYQEAWAEYRYIPNRVSGEMRSNYKQSLDAWHLADEYSSLPKLSSDWIEESHITFDRVLAVGSELSAQLFMDIFLKIEATRPMPMYSIPGLTRM